MELEHEFKELSIKFLFVCDNPLELSALLNDLNSLDYKSHQIPNVNIILQFLDSIPKISTTSDPNLIIKSCNLIKQLINKQKISLPATISLKIINWITKFQSSSINNFSCEALEVLSLLFKRNQSASHAVSSKKK
jgi:hypothetical protein